jgi:hypothetical protein
VIKVVGCPDDPRPVCAYYDCLQPGIMLDPRPRSVVSVANNCGFFYLCREHLTRAEIDWLRQGAPMTPRPDVLPGPRRRRRVAA